MKCPVCKKPMITLELNFIEIDYCTSCKGIWLDSGELELLLNGNNKSHEFIASFNPVENCKEPKKKCPICSKKMEKVSTQTTESVALDRCIKNHGIWFDSGELEKVLSLSQLNGNNIVINCLKEVFVNKNK
ncbi:MAG: zf-TFIIB domain-containing protein [Bacillota bacterium]|nr:zf-TFIIB domain-containing protein [Bacillota bacterium]